MSAFSTIPLRRLVDAGQWEAEDLAGRLGIVAHAAFLRAGFVPYGDELSSGGHLLKQVDEIGPSAPSLSRRYTAAQLARRREGAAEVVTVLELPVTGFASLPDDAKAEILRRLADGEDLARVECTSRQLRRLVAERDGELWKSVYKSLDLLAPEVQSSDEVVGISWKERYVNARQQPPPPTPVLFDPYDEDEWLLDQLAQERQELSEREFSFRFREEDEAIIEAYLMRALPPRAPEPELALAPAPEVVVVAREKNAGRQHRKVPRNEYKKQRRHGSGAIHSPSSRYRWKHR